MRKIIYIFIILSFSLIICACPFGTWHEEIDTSLYGYKITYKSEKKDYYSVNEEIKLTFNYDDVKNYCHDLTVSLDASDYDVETGYMLQSENVIIIDKDSGKNLANQTWTWDFDTYSEKDCEQEFTITFQTPGTYCISFKLEGNLNKGIYKRSDEFFHFSVLDTTD